MTEPLSPAAQAVVAAIEKFDWEAGHFSREDIWMLSREVTAAALLEAINQTQNGQGMISAAELHLVAMEMKKL